MCLLFPLPFQIVTNESPDLDFEYDDSDRYEEEIAGMCFFFMMWTFFFV
jgi:hypothetical protein